MVNWCCRYYNYQETGFYYLQTRYYDPAICRFINADTFATTDIDGLLSANMFSYCENNPVLGSDPMGEWVHLVVGAAVGIASQYLSDVALNVAGGKSLAKALRPTSSIVDCCSAAASGALAASGIGILGSVSINAGISGLACITESYANGKEPSVEEIGQSMLTGAASGIIGGKGAKGANLLGVYKTSKTTLKTAVSPKKISMYTRKIVNVKIKTAKAALRTFASNLFSTWARRR